MDESAGRVLFAIELTTPACPVKAEFERQAKAFVGELAWVTDGAAMADGGESGEKRRRPRRWRD